MLLIAGLVVALSAAACGSGGASAPSGATAPSGVKVGDTSVSPTSEAKAVEGGSLVVGVATDSTGWNPTLAQWADTGSLIGSSVLEPLAALGPNKEPKPWLAQSWTSNDKHDSWDIHLRPNVVFQNGEKFDASAAKQSIDFYLSGALTSLWLQPLIKEVVVVDPLTIRMNLKQPWGALPNAFLVANSYMMAPAMLASQDHGLTHPIGTGPFTFDSWKSGASFKAKKNPTYWQQGLPHLDSIEFRVIPDDTSRVQAIASGDVDLVMTTSASAAAERAGTDSVVKDWSTENAFVVTNTAPVVLGKDNPLNNIHARRAMAYATDRQAVTALIGDGVENPSSPWSPSNPWGMPDAKNGYVDFDLAKAKDEVAAYLKDTKQSKLAFTLNGQPDAQDASLMQLLQSEWHDAGIEIQLETVELNANIPKIITGAFQAAISHNYSFADPDSNYNFWTSSNANGVGKLSINFSQYSTPKIDADMEGGRASSNIDERRKLYNDVTVELNAGFTNIWLYRTPYSLIAQPKVKGLAHAQAVGFANTEPKCWIADIWMTTS